MNTTTPKTLKNGQTLSINHRGRKVTGTVESLTKLSADHALANACTFVLKGARREYGCMMRADGAAWVAC